MKPTPVPVRGGKYLQGWGIRRRIQSRGERRLRARLAAEEIRSEKD